MNDYEKSQFERYSDEELIEIIVAQGLEVPDNADRDTLLEIATSDESVPETERIDLSGDE